MNKVRLGLLGLLMLLVLSSARADDFPVTGSGASGRPGDRVYVNLTYNYGASFSAIAEDLDIQYAAIGLSMVADASTIDMFGTQTLHQYATTLQTFAQAHFGAVLENTNPQLSGGLKGYALSFYTADGVGHPRSGLVHLRVAFDIPLSAAPNSYTVSFINSVLVDVAEVEHPYPAALQSLKIVVLAVPEPSGLFLILPGLVLVGLRARRSGISRSS